ncbi:MAG: tetratricopeptide repeat protein, partial [Acidobacteriaceae bacterium]
VRDRELDRFVALKVIRPELAVRPEILQRFKQELILARQVTHKNVIRIFDLGEAEGVKFITMDFIEGKDLKSLLYERGKFSAEESVKIMAQVCRALEAAHSEGVVHRDLKPQNIMVDSQERVTVMDFGIARSIDMPGMTQTGAVIGTPEYMSPEQAKGERVDARSDLFTTGIIFYELLTGDTPFRADTAYAMLLNRTTRKARPPIELDPSIPQQINDVVVKCLETAPDQRYQSASEILEDLGLKTSTGTRLRPVTVGASTATVAEVPTPATAGFIQRYWKLIAGGATALLLVLVGVIFHQKIFPSGGKNVAGPSISLAILPFHNASGDASLDWLGASLAEMLQTDVGQSSSLHTVSPDRLHQVLNDLRITPDSSIDPSTLKRIGEFTNADRVVWGQYVKLGDQIRVDATLVDLKSQQRIPLKVEASGEKALLGTVDQLARSIRENLTLAPVAVDELKVSAFTPSSKSVDALRDYTQGLEFSRQGNHLQAQKQFEAATQADPNFALAYSKLGQTYASLGYDKEAEQTSRKALDLSNDLPPAEKYWIQATNARIVNNYPKAIEAYENLSKLLPNDPQVQFDLGSLYEDQGQFGPAHDHFSKALEFDPKYVDALLAVGRVEIRRGNAQGSLDSLNRALSLAVQLDDKQEKATIQQTIGFAYKTLDKLDDALQNFQEALSIRKQIGDKRGQAASLGAIALVREAQGKLDEARSTYEQSLKIQKEMGDKHGVGTTLINLGELLRSQGQIAGALDYTKQALQIEQDVGNENYQALCLNNIGAIYFNSGQFDDALTYFKQSLDLREKLAVPADIAQTLNNVGDSSAKMAHFDQALSSYLRALDLWRKADDKSGIAMTSSGMATLFEYQGRFGAALDAQQEAIKNLQQLPDRGPVFAETQADYGNALSLVGRQDDARVSLDQALALARQLQDNPLIATILNFQGDRLFYGGDLKGAHPLYDEALQTATRAKDREGILLSKFNQAKLSVKDGHGSAVAGTLRPLAHEADGMGLKFLSTQCAVYLGEALITAKDYSHARQELDGAIRTSEDLGMRALLPQANYLESLALRGSGDTSGADHHLQEAVKTLEEMHKESKSDAILRREDLRSIAEAGAHLSSK